MLFFPFVLKLVILLAAHNRMSLQSTVGVGVNELGKKVQQRQKM
jgi:hypothetical protein